MNSAQTNALFSALPAINESLNTLLTVLGGEDVQFALFIRKDHFCAVNGNCAKADIIPLLQDFVARLEAEKKAADNAAATATASEAPPETSLQH